MDGLTYRVPNCLTAHFALGGLAFAYWTAGLSTFVWSVQGLFLGLVLLLPIHAIGGIGAGDVKLLAGLGAWVGASTILGAFATSAIAGGLMGLGMILWTGQVRRHCLSTESIFREVITIGQPGELSRLAELRKPEATLLPYAIPIAIGSIGYFAWMGMLGKF